MEARGVRDKNLLDSALEAPFSSLSGINPYPSVEAKAARLGYGLIKNHPFVDGNKRIGILAMLVFLELNGIIVNSTDEDLIQLGLDLASSKITNKDLLSWIIVSAFFNLTL